MSAARLHPDGGRRQEKAMQKSQRARRPSVTRSQSSARRRIKGTWRSYIDPFDPRIYVYIQSAE